MTTFDDYVEALMVLPTRPHFIGFVMPTEQLFKMCMDKLTELAGTDLSEFCTHDAHDEDWQFYIYIDSDAIADEMGEEDYEKLVDLLPFSIDESWEVTEHLLGWAFNTGTWAYATVRSHNHYEVEVQIGVPRFNAEN